MVGVAFYTLLERKLLGYQQHRKGPTKPSIAGILTPFADAVKLITKERNLPERRNKILFIGVPWLTLMVPLLLWRVYPRFRECVFFKYSVLWVLCVSSVGVYALLGAGWSRNSKYSMFGAIRAVAQTVSYEVSISIIIIHSILFYQFTLYLPKITTVALFLFIPMFLLCVRTLAETNRTPFDFSEGESELVRGYNTEFRAVPFVLIFLSEYISILLISALITLLYTWSNIADGIIFLLLFAVLFVWCRGTLPRLRYDQLIYLAWKSFLPSVLCSAGLFITL